MAIDHILWTNDFGIRAGRQLCCDSENLYVYLFTVKDEVGAAYRIPLFPACQDSCLESFFTSEDYESDFNQTDMESRSIEEVEPGGTGGLGEIDEVMSKVSLGHLDALMKNDGA